METAPVNLKFILDAHLGKLTKFLRLCGFDSFYDSDFDDTEIISLALSANRIILTRDKELLKNKRVKQGYRVLSQHPEEQLKEVFEKFELKNMIKPFTRCLECNGLLKDVPKEEVLADLLPGTRENFHNFKKCTACSRVYWEGSHYERMCKFIDSLVRLPD